MIVEINSKYEIGKKVGHSTIVNFGAGVIVGILVTNNDATKVLYSVVFETGESNFFHEVELISEEEHNNRIIKLEDE